MNTPFKKRLSAATCALLASTCVQAENNLQAGDWDVSTAFLFYSETDRVQAAEPIINVRKQFDTDESLNLKLTLDALTGASGTGAVPSAVPQTFTRPSGNGSYVTSSGNTPLDDTFKDGRVALALTWNRPAWGGTTSALGLSFSNEYDYRHLGTSAIFAKNINNANTTLSGGLSLAADSISPVGGRPFAFANLQPAGENPLRSSEDTEKTTVDVIAGFTQVIDAGSLFQFNYSLSASNGYHTDPYKFISVVDGTTGRPLFENATTTTLPTVVYENRPDSRTRHSVYGQYKKHLNDAGDILDASYRFMFDDWGINSHTLDFRYRKQLGKRRFLQPHLRIYQQSAADFFTPFYVQGTQPASGDSNTHASADYRLGEFNAYTVGLEFGQDNLKNSWSVALEYYLQLGDEPAGKFAELNQLELYPDVDAVIVRFLYDF